MFYLYNIFTRIKKFNGMGVFFKEIGWLYLKDNKEICLRRVFDIIYGNNRAPARYPDIPAWAIVYKKSLPNSKKFVSLQIE